ncbi:Protein ccc1 [Teratosphaeriaceae sp. CCFEE 6253]|nr:Protein ccc1 [Teratosphaeriaceae sp. CCFEE 6253]
MAALLLKSVLSPNNDTSKYTPLRADDSSTIHHRGASSDSGIAMSDSFVDEKLAATHARARPTRINPRVIRDATIGLSDGLTVPFALVTGLSALGSSSVVIYGGLAELIAGAISMGLGGYLGAKSEAEAYQAALAETRAIVENDHQTAASLVRDTFGKYDFPEDALASMVSSLRASSTDMVDFLMHFHHQLAEADYTPTRAYVSGLTIASGYVVARLSWRLLCSPLAGRRRLSSAKETDGHASRVASRCCYLAAWLLARLWDA